MKIVSKLIVAFVCSAVVVVVVGLAGVSKLNQADQRFNAFTSNILPSVELLAQTQNQTWAARNEVWKHLAQPDAAGKLASEQIISKRLDEVEKSLRAYEPMVVDAEDKRLLDQSKQRLREYREGLPETLALSRQGDQAGAVQRTLQGRGNRLVAAMDEHVLYNRKLAEQLQQANHDAARAALIQLALVLAVVLVAMAAGGTLLCRAISQGLRQMQQAMTVISSDLDFTRRVAVMQQDEIGVTTTAFNALLDRLQHSLQDMKRGIVEVTSTVQQLQLASGRVAESSVQQSNASAHMAAAIEQMTVSLSHVADRAHKAHSLSAEGAGQASLGQQAIGQVVADIGEIARTVTDTAHEIGQLAERSQSIESVVNVIREVAEQTNLLALNAAIEAARAGESGRGFAVVADEVRKLAERTAASTQEIGKIITAIQQVTGNVVSRMEQAVGQVTSGQQGVSAAQQNIAQLLAGAQASASVVQEISAAIREQSMATSSIAQQVETVAQGAEANSSAAAHAANMATTLEQVAASMQQEVRAYRV
ncbi:MAG: methyl-accepting chemotaxis protein [Vogesella sp.]|uniref:methyl-accepting chemotaxis protein n=1 Tax=Vogesella sp. TaxID=1904252 RepID=UPI00391A37B6